MMVFHYLGADPALSATFDEGYRDEREKPVYRLLSTVYPSGCMHCVQ
jgi:hypothetical protein